MVELEYCPTGDHESVALKGDRISLTTPGPSKILKSYIKRQKPYLPKEAVSCKLDNTNPTMKQPRSKLNRSSLDELKEYSALLIELYHFKASKGASPKGRCNSCSFYNKVLYQILCDSLDRAWLYWQSCWTMCSVD